MGSAASRQRAVAETEPPGAPEAPGAPEVDVAPAAAQDPVFKSCWSCRVLSGSGLVGAGVYVYLVSRRPLKQGYPPGPGTIAQMVVGISIACWGVVILTDPKGKAYPVA